MKREVFHYYCGEDAQMENRVLTPKGESVDSGVVEPCKVGDENQKNKLQGT
jgi:hypothetical protein